MNSRWLTIKQLDRQLKEWQAVSKKYGRPRDGWVKTLRVALSMSAEQLASRLGLTRSRITQLENAEIHDAVTLRTLKEAANAMECEFVYAIVPKNQTSLEDIIKRRAEQIAKERVARIAHSMSLEAQSVDTDILKKHKEDLAKNLMEHLNKKFWSTLDNSEDYQNKESIRTLAEALYNQEQKNNDIFNNINNQELGNMLNKYFCNNNKNLHNADIVKKLKEPAYFNALRDALVNLEKNNDDTRKNSQKDNLLKKLIENLQKKK
jgi:predicted DNA-binding mobile mystery protein A